TLKWYANSSGGSPVNTGPTYSPSLTSTTTFYVSCTSAEGCEGPRAPVTGTINPIPGAPSTTPGARCGSGIVNLSASGTGTLKWYSDAGLSNLVNTGGTFSPSLTVTTTFYVTATSAAGCVSDASPVTGVVNPVPVCAITPGSTQQPL